jgi:hypothetical protein
MRRAVAAHLVGQGKTHEEAEAAINELLEPLVNEAMKRHYQDHEPYADVDAWYTGAVREKLAAAGYVSILPKEDA